MRIIFKLINTNTFQSKKKKKKLWPHYIACDLSSSTKNSALKVLNPNHWTAREFSKITFNSNNTYKICIKAEKEISSCSEFPSP